MTDGVLAELIALVGVSHRSGALVAAAALEEVFGTPVPADYVRYVQTVPPGVYRDTLSVLQPAADGSVTELRAALEFQRGLIRDDGGPGHLIPWAAIGTDYVMCWIADDGDADTWWTGVFDGYGGAALYPFGGGCVDFLLAFATGGTGIEVLDYVYKRVVEPMFVAFEEPPRLPPAQLDPLGWSRLYDALLLPMEPVDAGPELVARLGASVTPAATDWTAVAARLGSPLPADYRNLVDAGVDTRIGPVRLAIPGGAPDLADLPSWILERVLAANSTTGGVRRPYHPEDGGLVPFGLFDDGSVVGWPPVDPDPDRWPVTVASADFRAVVSHPLTATAFLLRLLTGPQLFLPS